jgi:hypothetical protein
MRVMMLCEVWRAWKDNAQLTASLGDGQWIEAVGRAHRGVCEVHGTRGVENRHSTEHVLCEDIETHEESSHELPSDEESR